ncbi:MAG: glucose-1-phosphate cytidylyltransferase [Deltaproteobacteria bacterium]|nr:glucose-1-phosphate cytidylyltransferase [Deltaproteobacteria bacterium]MBW2307326.1 glucose-1-phosphate cytidylyltransferase [Deltaproteobacteria bacterium]
MKVVILCGGQGTRLREETEFRPKPLLEIGNFPILWHIMKTYSHYGFNQFILCLGYKGYMIKEYFLKYEIMTRNFTITLGNSQDIIFHNGTDEENWRITFAETGQNAMTGARVRRIKEYIDTKTFMLTYGDGVADIPLDRLVSFHFSHGKIATVSGVHPPSRFGEMITNDHRVVSFSEKPQTTTGMINGGFFVLDYKIFDYLDDDEDLVFEREPMQRLTRDGQLMVYPHEGFWQPMDTYREFRHLNQLWASGQAYWKVWS